jgi:hypothetical protein
VELGKASTGDQRVGGIKGRVRIVRAIDGSLAPRSELLEKILDLMGRELGQRNDYLTLDQAELRLQLFDFPSQQFADCAPY